MCDSGDFYGGNRRLLIRNPLKLMLEDMTDFVRQAELLGITMIYMQHLDMSNGNKIKSFHEKLVSIIGEKHQSTLTKMGDIMSTGLLGAGGENFILRLVSRNGFTNITIVVGLAMWIQHWHWFPMMHLLSLALTPTFAIGKNKISCASDQKYVQGVGLCYVISFLQFAIPYRGDTNRIPIGYNAIY